MTDEEIDRLTTASPPAHVTVSFSALLDFTLKLRERGFRLRLKGGHESCPLYVIEPIENFRKGVSSE